MPTKVSEVHVNEVLSNYSVAYENSALVADIIAPFVKVMKEADTYYKFGFESWQIQDVDRAIGAPANKGRWTTSTDTYSCKEKAWTEPLAQRIIDNEDKPINAKKRATAKAKDTVRLAREKRVRDLAYNNFTTAGALAAGAKWDNYTSATSVPLEDIKTAKTSVRTTIWKPANFMVMTQTVAEALALHPDILDMVKYTHSDLLTQSGLPKILRGLNVLEAGAGYVSSETDTTPTEIWGDDVYVMYVNTAPALDTVNTITSFASRIGRVREWFDEEAECWNYEYSEIVDEKLVTVGGYVIKDVLT